VHVTHEAVRVPGGRILVIDDEPHIRRVLSTVLDAHGFRVSSAADGARGLAAFHAGKADLVILDLMLPDANGLEILSKIRASSSRPDTPVIILTAMAGGANDFMTKPFSPKKLIARIDEILAEG
jgi:DNA-binding response OmpR family regulator